MVATDSDIEAASAAVIRALQERNLTVATAESCTGGWVAKAITDIAGSSAVFETGVVSYSNKAKAALLNVDPEIIEKHGAVSAANVEQMVQGALQNSQADIAVAVSGIAGPGGGSDEKPVGTVWFACGSQDGIRTDRQLFAGDRELVRRQSVLHALAMIQGVVSSWS